LHLGTVFDNFLEMDTPPAFAVSIEPGMLPPQPMPIDQSRQSTIGTIFNIMRFAVNDGPGIRTTVFLKGCPLHCAWCHNPESMSPQPEVFLRDERCIRCGSCADTCTHQAVERTDGAFITLREKCAVCGDCVDVCAADAREIVGRDTTVQELVDEVERDRVFFDQSGGGVTFSGGEPLQQFEFLLAALEESKRRRIHTAVDTTGFTTPDILERVAAVTDLFLFDLKTMNDDVHRRFTGVSNALIVQNLQRLVNGKKNVIVRVPIIPGINDDDEALARTGAFVAELGGVSELHLLPYHEIGVHKYGRLGKDNPLPPVPIPTWERMNEAVAIMRRFLPNVRVGG
jgi:pyruvate formate lyase activating enzyme